MKWDPLIRPQPNPAEAERKPLWTCEKHNVMRISPSQQCPMCREEKQSSAFEELLAAAEVAACWLDNYPEVQAQLIAALVKCKEVL